MKNYRRNPKILIVEDDITLFSTYSESLPALRDTERIIFSTTAENTIKQIESHEIAVAIVKTYLHGCDALALIEKIRNRNKICSIFLISSHVLILEQLKRVLKVGIRDIIQEREINCDFFMKVRECYCQYLESIDKNESHERLRYLAFHDELTGLYNRRYSDEELNRINVERSYPISLILVDVNNLKIVNDTFGHEQGDLVIKCISQKMSNCVRKEDVIARIGGDEFIIILSNTTRDRTEEIIKSIKNVCVNCKKCVYRDKSQKIKTGISAGYVYLDTFTENLHQYLRHADDDMYRDKMNMDGTKENEFLMSLIEIMKQKDFYTEESNQRIGYLAIKMSEVLNMTIHEQRDLALTMYLHDIGKIGISDSILFKKSRLCNEELESIKKHSILGHNILRRLKKFESISKYVLYHHERWDGRGYPEGLSGEAIPLVSRVVSIIDSYDAILSKRPYSDAMSDKEAIDELIKNQGTQFDPSLVDLFVEIVKHNKFKFNEVDK